MTLGTWVTRNGRGAALCMALLVGAGAFAYAQLPSGLYPELSFPRIAVVASLPDATSELVLRNVTRPIEEALMPLVGVRRVRSKTIRGAVEVAVLFDPDTDLARALTLVQGALGPLRTELPAATSVVAERVSPTSFPILTLNVDGNVPPEDLRDVALHQIRPALSRLPGVGLVTVTSGFTREVEVEVQTARARGSRPHRRRNRAPPDRRQSDHYRGPLRPRLPTLRHRRAQRRGRARQPGHRRHQ